MGYNNDMQSNSVQLIICDNDIVKWSELIIHDTYFIYFFYYRI